jgi:hypothetical protein
VSQRVFISYRRSDASGHAGRLYDALAARFGDPNVFMDVEMAPGIDFVRSIGEAVGSCHVLVVVIGPHWTSIARPDGVRRLDADGDYVRLEVETALQRDDVVVIPALVGGATMPEPAQLPPSLQALSRRNAVELSDGRWRYDAGRVVTAVEEALGGLTEAHPTPLPPPVGPAPAPAPTSALGASPPMAALLGGVVAGVAGVAGRALAAGLPVDAPGGDDKVAIIAYHAMVRSVTWAVVIAALGALAAVAGAGRWAAVPAAVGGVCVGVAAGIVAGVLDGLAARAGLFGIGAGTASLLGGAVLPIVAGAAGWYVGRSWRPRHAALGLAAGVAAGLLGRLLATAIWHVDPGWEQTVVLLPQGILVGALVFLAVTAADVAPAGRPEVLARVAHH